MRAHRRPLVILALILLVVLGAVTGLRVVMGAGAQSPGPPATILYSTMLTQEFPVSAVAPDGTVYLGGDDVAALAPGSRRVTWHFGLPRQKVSRQQEPVVWVREIGAGGDVVAATGETTGTWPAPLERNGARVHPRGASTLVAWRVGAGHAARYVALGGTCNQSPRAIAVDAHGNILVAGVTTSDDFPILHAAQAAFAGPPNAQHCPGWQTGLENGDVFLTRLDPRGRITYSTYLGGTDADEPRAVATDTAGNMYVAGVTYSSDFPHVRGFERPGHGPVLYRDSNGNSHYWWRDFVAKLDRQGRLLWVTMLPLGSDSGEVHGIAVGNGAVYLVGDTASGDVPTVHAAQSSYGGGSCSDYDGASTRCRDAWVAKLSPNGHIRFTTYLGGSGDDVGTSIAVGSDGAVYVGGTTASTGIHFPDFWFTDFPRVRTVSGSPGGTGQCGLPQPCGDAFVAKLSKAGVLEGSWTLGGSDNEELLGLGLDSRDHVYASGYTSSCNFPVRAGARLRLNPFACPAAFVTELRLP